VSTGNGTGNGSLLVTVGNTLTRCQNRGISEASDHHAHLSGEVSGTTLGHLENDGGLLVAGSLEGSNNGGGRGDVLVVDRQQALEAMV